MRTWSNPEKYVQSLLLTQLQKQMEDAFIKGYYTPLVIDYTVLPIPKQSIRYVHFSQINIDEYVNNLFYLQKEQK